MTKKQLEKLKELYTRYNQCRDAELDRFWKNSVFVWVFLALCFAAFGTLMKDFNMPTKAMCDAGSISKDDYYMFLAIISGIGLILSYIWLWMARGLKAWYEVYENAIWEIETCKNEFEYSKKYTIENFWAIKDNKGCLRAKPFSPSKIVILIGWLLIIVWFLTYGYSLIKLWTCGLYTWCYYCTFSMCDCCLLRKEWPSYLLALVPIIILIIGRIKIESSTLRDKGHNDVFKNIQQELMDNSKVSSLYFEVKNKEVSFFLHQNNANEEYETLKTTFSNIQFQYKELYIAKCSYKEMLKRFQTIDNFRKLLITDFALYHKKITIDNDQLILSPLDSIKMRDVKNILDKHIKECKYLNEKYDDLSYIVEHKIVLSGTKIQIPMDLLESLNINFRIKFKYYKRVLMKKIFHFCGNNK